MKLQRIGQWVSVFRNVLVINRLGLLVQAVMRSGLRLRRVALDLFVYRNSKHTKLHVAC